MERILSFADKINNIKSNPYLVKLQQNPPLTNFLTSQDSFIDAVDYWSKILALILTQLPGYIERVVIINNLYDEHGSGNPDNSHVNTFRQFIDSLGYHKDLELYDETTKTYDIVKNFNDQLIHFIGINHWISNVALIAMIEYVYITISASIHNYVKQYISPEEISHYGIHEVMDVKHSTELFELLVPYSLSDHYKIQIGLEEGYKLFDELYTKLSHFL